MDLGTAVITLAVGAIAVLPRVPALSAAGREQARLQRDSELWSTMPQGASRDRLGAHIEQGTHQLLQERGRDKTVENGWLVGTAWTAVAWALLVTSTAVNGDEAWARYLRTALEFGGLAAGVLGVLIVTVTVALLAWKAFWRAYAWVRRGRRGSNALTYDI